MPTGTGRPYTAKGRAKVKRGESNAFAAFNHDAYRQQELKDLPNIKRNLRAKAAFNTNKTAKSPAAFDPYNGGRKNNMTATEALPRRTTTKLSPYQVNKGASMPGLNFFNPKSDSKPNWER